MDIHVITPFSRPLLLPQLLPMLEREGVQWHPIIHQAVEFDRDWIHPMSVNHHPTGVDPCYWKLNQWITHGEIVDEDFYCFFCDDDAYESGFFDRVRMIDIRDVLFVSMMQCHHNNRILPVAPDKIGWDRTGLQQFFVTGRVLRTMSFANSPRADGIMALWLLKTYKCDFDNGLVVYANRLHKQMSAATIEYPMMCPPWTPPAGEKK